MIILLLSLPQWSNGQGFLKVDGKQIKNDVDKNFILRGMGLGGYMLQEGYMFRLKFLGQQYKIREKVAAFAGEKKAADFYQRWLQLNTTMADITAMAGWGFNSIRLPIHYNLFTLSAEDEPVKGKNTWLSAGFELVDSLLDWCRQSGMYLILDLHAAPGGQGHDLAISDRDPHKPSLWESKENQEKTIALWEKIAERYAGEPFIGGYDILNETNWGFEDADDKRGVHEQKNVPLRNLLIDITRAIRSVDTNHIIFLEGNGFANNYDGIFPLWDDNLVISFHKYGNFSTKETIQNFLEMRDRYNVPLWLGECGENSNTWFTNTIRLMEDNDIGWCWWQLKKMGINNPLEIKEPEQYALFVEFCRGMAAKPDSTTANGILDEWLGNLRFENNIFHRDVTDAMFRQVHSQETIPFKQHIVRDSLTVMAADYDLGRNNYAYRDADTASYIYTPGVNTQGNRGRIYRNDGVDIRLDGSGNPEVFDIEDGEWLLYTIEAVHPGLYRITLFADSVENGHSVALEVNGEVVRKNQMLLPGPEKSKPAISEVPLQKGLNRVKIIFEKGGFNFRYFTLEK